MRVIVSGGGTGGHIYPALTILRTLQKKVKDLEVLYVGTSQGLESDIIPKEGLPFATVEVQSFKRSLSPENFLRAMKAMAGVIKARGIVKNFNPDVVIGTGGYVCGPILMAASLSGIPTMVQEQNVLPGITNKILSRFVDCIATGSPEALKYFPKEKSVFTGNPIRSEVMDTDSAKGYQELGLDPDKKTILVSGGSRGARTINQSMVGVLKHYANDDELQILMATGKGEYEGTMQKIKEAGLDLDKCDNLQVKPYLYNMPMAMSIADLAVFRAGATGLAELTAKGIPSILVPYPYASENHQEYNARAVENAGAAKVILNKDLNADILIDTIESLLANSKILRKMSAASKLLGRPQAADVIADIIIELARSKKN